VAAIESFGKKLEAATNGRLSVRMYPSMQLGGEKETIEQTQIGAVQWLAVNAGALGSIVDDIHALPVPQHRACRKDDGRAARTGMSIEYV
jgi:TRAP-type C4-dicarboxylate transport system substrate-binding protein